MVHIHPFTHEDFVDALDFPSDNVMLAEIHVQLLKFILEDKEFLRSEIERSNKDEHESYETPVGVALFQEVASCLLSLVSLVLFGPGPGPGPCPGPGPGLCPRPSLPFLVLFVFFFL